MSKKRSRKNQAATAKKSFEFNPDYTFIKRDLKRIGILAGSFVLALVALSFIIN